MEMSGQLHTRAASTARKEPNSESTCTVIICIQLRLKQNLK